MNIQTNIPLAQLTTMKIGGPANYVADITSRAELEQLYLNAQKLSQPVYIIGGGSNLIAHDEGFHGIIGRMQIKGIEIVSDDAESTTIRSNGGEVWDELVAFTVDRDLYGIDAMSGIPGTVGAAPVQNIGAYGQELADTFVSLEAFDTQSNKFVELTWQDCKFSYRHSIFRGEYTGRYVIISVTLRLAKRRPEPPFYKSLQAYFEANNTTDYTVQAVRTAVLSIRSSKLPDPKLLPNSGSFFKNPIVESWKVDDLRKTYDDIPAFTVDPQHAKIPAGWLIERADLKGKVFDGMKVHDDNAVVLINQSASSYGNLASAREEIISVVRDKYQIQLEQEPLELSPSL